MIDGMVVVQVAREVVHRQVLTCQTVLFEARAQVWLAPDGGIVGGSEQCLQVSRYLRSQQWLKEMAQYASLQYDWTFVTRSSCACHRAVAVWGIWRRLTVGMLDPGLGCSHGVGMVVIHVLGYSRGVLDASATKATLLLECIPQAGIC